MPSASVLADASATGWHAPAAHVPPWHEWKHAPQFPGSVCSSTQVPHMEPVQEQAPWLQSGVGCAHAAPVFTQPPIALQTMGCAPLQPRD